MSILPSPVLRAGFAALACGSCLLGASLAAPRAVQAAPPPYPQAVAFAEKAARAVLARAGREICLRGKLTRALLGLSGSCEASGTRTGLCSLADKAVVVTPMSLAFMDQTSHQLLDLIGGGSGAPPAASVSVAAPIAPEAGEP